MVDAIALEAGEKLERPATPPVIRNAADVGEAFVARLDGSPFRAPIPAGAEVSKRLDQWSNQVSGVAKTTLVLQLDPPDRGDAWFLSVLGRGAEGGLLPIEQALTDSKRTQHLADEIVRLERLYDKLGRAGGLRRGQVYLSQDEAWELMTVTGPALESAGFEVRVPAMSRRKPTPALRLFVEPTGETVVGANQLSDVRWSAVFDDVELTAADVARLAAEARPLVRSHGKWVELDRVDLKEAAAALAERAGTDKLTGAEILRQVVGLEGTPFGAGLTVDGSGWVTDLLEKASAAPTAPVTKPEGFVGELRSYQAEALGWLGFLDAVGLGGCLALDMGLGKTPTVLAHLARTQGAGPALVIAPPAVVGNWAAEAARFTPGLRVVVHHGASRASAEELEAEVADADVFITTYGTAVRDIDALEQHDWDRLVLDEAQAIKNHTNETSQVLRRIEARTRLALTGTPIENGLGDLWSILDFTNPGLVGGRTTFISQLSGEGEQALHALNGILVFRRTKTEPSVAAELPDRIDELDHCTMTAEQIGLYQAVLDGLVVQAEGAERDVKQGAILAAITALKQICNHPWNYQADDKPLAGRSGKLNRLEEVVEQVFEADERILIFTQFATWGVRLAAHLSEVTGKPIHCYHGGLARGRTRRDDQGVPGGRRRWRHRAVAQGGRHRAQPHRRQPRRPLRPLVEPRRRGPGPRPRLAHRPDPHGAVAPARVPGHRRRARRGGGGRQAPHRRPRAPEEQLARRPRSRSAARRSRPPDRPAPRGGRHLMAQQGKKRSSQRKRGGGGKHKPVDIWRPVPPLPDPEPIAPATDPTALLRSIGAPPLRARSDMAEAYLVAVAERAAGLATALAAAANLLAEPATDDAD